MKTENSHSFLLAGHEQELENFITSVQLVLCYGVKRAIITFVAWDVTQGEVVYILQ